MARDLGRLLVGQADGDVLGVEAARALLALTLRPIERAIGELAEASRRPPRRPGSWRPRPNTTAPRPRPRRSPTASRARSAIRVRDLAVDAREDQGELLASDPGGGVGAADDTRQRRADGPQHLVPVRVAVSVVHRLEVVEVQHHQGHWTVVASRALQLSRQGLLKPAVVGQAGEGVGCGQASKPSTCRRWAPGSKRHRPQQSQGAEAEQRRALDAGRRQRDHAKPQRGQPHRSRRPTGRGERAGPLAGPQKAHRNRRVQQRIPPR